MVYIMAFVLLGWTTLYYGGVSFTTAQSLIRLKSIMIQTPQHHDHDLHGLAFDADDDLFYTILDGNLLFQLPFTHGDQNLTTINLSISNTTAMPMLNISSASTTSALKIVYLNAGADNDKRYIVAYHANASSADRFQVLHMSGQHLASMSSPLSHNDAAVFTRRTMSVNSLYNTAVFTADPFPFRKTIPMSINDITYDVATSVPTFTEKYTFRYEKDDNNSMLLDTVIVADDLSSVVVFEKQFVNRSYRITAYEIDLLHAISECIAFNNDTPQLPCDDNKPTVIKHAITVEPTLILNATSVAIAHGTYCDGTSSKFNNDSAPGHLLLALADNAYDNTTLIVSFCFHGSLSTNINDDNTRIHIWVIVSAALGGCVVCLVVMMIVCCCRLSSTPTRSNSNTKQYALTLQSSNTSSLKTNGKQAHKPTGNNQLQTGSNPHGAAATEKTLSVPSNMGTSWIPCGIEDPDTNQNTPHQRDNERTRFDHSKDAVVNIVSPNDHANGSIVADHAHDAASRPSPEPSREASSPKASSHSSEPKPGAADMPDHHRHQHDDSDSDSDSEDEKERTSLQPTQSVRIQVEQLQNFDSTSAWILDKNRKKESPASEATKQRGLYDKLAMSKQRVTLTDNHNFLWFTSIIHASLRAVKEQSEITRGALDKVLNLLPVPYRNKVWQICNIDSDIFIVHEEYEEFVECILLATGQHRLSADDVDEEMFEFRDMSAVFYRIVNMAEMGNGQKTLSTKNATKLIMRLRNLDSKEEIEANDISIPILTGFTRKAMEHSVAYCTRIWWKILSNVWWDEDDENDEALPHRLSAYENTKRRSRLGKHAVVSEHVRATLSKTSLQDLFPHLQDHHLDDKDEQKPKTNFLKV